MNEINKSHLEKAGANEDGVEGLTNTGKHAQETLIGLIAIGNLLYNTFNNYYKILKIPIHTKIMHACFTYL